MNRETRRKIKKASFNTKVKKKVDGLKEKPIGFEEGQKVKLNIKKIESKPWFRKNKKSNEPHIMSRNQFIYENESTIFEVVYYPECDGNHMVCLKKDDAHCPWIFPIDELEKVE